MSKTLSANITAGKYGNANEVYLVQIHASDGTIYYYATEDFLDADDDDRLYDGGMILQGGIGNLKQAIEVSKGGNVSFPDDFTIKLSNSGALHETFDVKEFTNQLVEVRLIFTSDIDGARADAFWSNAVPFGYGYILTPYWNESEYVFPVAGGYFNRHRDLPKRKLSKEEFPDMADSLIGKAVPLIYGNFAPQGLHKSGVPLNGTDNGVRDFVKYYLVKRAVYSVSDGIILCCSHDIFGRYAIFAPWGYDETRFARWLDNLGIWGMFKRVPYGAFAFADGLLTGAEADIHLIEDANEHLAFIVPSTKAFSHSSQNPGSCVDTTASTPSTVGDGQFLSYACPIKMTVSSEATETLTIFLQATYSTTLVNDKLKYEITGDCLVTSPTTGYVTALTGSPTNLASIPVNSGVSLDTLEIKFSYETNSGADGGHFTIDNLFFLLNVSGSVTNVTEVYDCVKGREYGSWIDEAAHDNDLDEGDLLESPAYLIESLLIDELGLTTANLDIPSFDEIGLLKTDWKIARELLEAKNSRDLIQEICQEFGFAYVESYNGKPSLKRITASALNIGTITTTNILMDGDRTSFKVAKTPLTDLCNEFSIKYRENYATGEFEKELYVRNADAASWNASYSNLVANGEANWNLCHANYLKIGTVRKWEFTAKWIRDSETAEWFLKWIIPWITKQRHIASFAAALDLIGTDILDESHINHPLLPSSVNNTAARFRCTGIDSHPEKNRVNYTFLECS